MSEKDNTIIELHSLREKDQENTKRRMDELNKALNDNVTRVNQGNQELQERDGTIDHLNEELDGLKGELEKYKLREVEMEKYLQEVQRMNAKEVERMNKEQQEELQAVKSKHVAELENVKLLMTKQLEETGQEVKKLRQVYDSEVHELKGSLSKRVLLQTNLEQQMERLGEDFDNVVACLREKDAALERLQSRLKELEASSASEINLLRSELKNKAEEIAELENKIANEEEKNLKASNKLTKLEEGFLKVTEERNRLVNETDVLTDTQKLLQERMATLHDSLFEVTDEQINLYYEIELLRTTHHILEQSMTLLEQSTCPVTNQIVGGSSLVEDSVERIEVRQSAGFTEGTVLWVKDRVLIFSTIFLFLFERMFLKH